jgi:hypothetical protein
MIKKDAILDKDVSDKDVDVDETIGMTDEEILSEDNQETTKLVNPREAAMKAIIANRNKELGVKQESDEDEDNEDDSQSTKLYEVKIDGASTEVDLDTLIRSYQKDSTASKRLDEASKKFKEIKTLEDSLLEKQKDLEKIEQALKENKSKEKVSTDSEESEEQTLNLSDLVEQIREGDKEDAVKAMEAIYNSLKNKKDVDQTSVKAVVTQAIREEKEQLEKAQKESAERRLKEEMAEAEKKFSEVYAKEMESDDFFDLAVMEDNKLQRDPTWDSRSLEERYIEAGNRAKVWMSKREDERQKKKEKATGVSQNSSRKGVETPIKKPKTPSDVIANMRKARGQTL